MGKRPWNCPVLGTLGANEWGAFPTKNQNWRAIVRDIRGIAPEYVGHAASRIPEIQQEIRNCWQRLSKIFFHVRITFPESPG